MPSCRLVAIYDGRFVNRPYNAFVLSFKVLRDGKPIPYSALYLCVCLIIVSFPPMPRFYLPQHQSECL